MTRATRLFSAARYTLLVVLVAASTVLASGEGKHSRDDALFSASAYRDWVAYLSSDELEGRGTGEEGIDEAQDFIAAVFEQYGVEPAGDDGTYFQNFSLQLEDAIGRGTRLAIGTDARRTRRRVRLHEDFVPLPWSESGSFKGGVVFAGYGIVNENEQYDDYADIDVAGKVVLLLRRGPSFGNFGMHDKSFRTKANRAADRDAVAIMIVNRNGNEALYDFKAGGQRRRGYGIPMLHITPRAANRMLSAADMPDIQALQDKIEDTQRPASAPLEGVTVKGKVAIVPVETPVRNVVGLIRGQGPQSDEIIVLGAHHDHLGIKGKNKPGFDPDKHIYNGADDNASGTAMVMNMAKAYTQGAPPNRSILLMTFTGEEIGLLGSRHFVKHATVDLDKCVAMLNFDMVGRLKNDNLEVGGARTGEFEDMVHELAEDYGLDISDGGGGGGPSDHSSFYSAGIPVLFLFTGIHRQYHQPEDDVPLINSDGAMRIARFTTDIVDRIDAEADAPPFHKDRRRAKIARQKPRKDESKVDDATQAEPYADPHTTAGTPRRARLGIRPQPDDERGILVAEVVDDSPAKRAGLESGDRIVKLGGHEIDDLEDLLAALGKLKAGDEVKMKIERGDKQLTLDVFFGKKEKKTPTLTREPESLAQIGASLTKLLSDLQEKHEADDTLEGVKTVWSKNRIEISVKFVASARGNELAGEFLAEAARLIEDRPPLKLRIAMKMCYDFGSSSFSTNEITVVVEESKAQHGRKADKAHPAKSPKKEKRTNPNADMDEADDADDLPSMPGVRLGIIPTYGEPEGEGFEISGVVEGGPAAAGGMEDDDRIYKIGNHVIADVYDYMDALRSFKPGDKVKVIVIRDGKKVALEIKAGAPKSNEAS